ncbi:hypothetical protein AB6735_24140 [Mucilaginibacter sp. RCC_168]
MLAYWLKAIMLMLSDFAKLDSLALSINGNLNYNGIGTLILLPR